MKLEECFSSKCHREYKKSEETWLDREISVLHFIWHLLSVVWINHNVKLFQFFLPSMQGRLLKLQNIGSKMYLGETRVHINWWPPKWYPSNTHFNGCIYFKQVLAMPLNRKMCVNYNIHNREDNHTLPILESNSLISRTFTSINYFFQLLYKAYMSQYIHLCLLISALKIPYFGFKFYLGCEVSCVHDNALHT